MQASLGTRPQARNVRRVAVFAALIATLIVNTLANLLPLAGRTPGEISDMFPVPFTPAGYVFSIWSVIYLGLIAYAIYQALPAQQDNPRVMGIAWPFVLSCALNCVWLFAWHSLAITLSWFIMLALLATLIWIYQRLGTGQSEVSRSEALAVRAPFSVYLGWITVATVANTSIMLYNLGWQGEGLVGELMTALVITVAVAIGVTMLVRRRDVAYNLVLVWAFVGIAVARWGEADLAAWSALLGALAVAVAIGISLARPPRRNVQA